MAAASGVRFNDEGIEKFMELKKKKAYRYIILKIDEKAQEIIVEKLGPRYETYDEFSSCFPESEPRFGVFDLDFVTSDNRPTSKILFVAWSPDTARVKSKMLYASSKETCKRNLDGIHIVLQATDPTEMELELVKERAAK